MRTLLVAVAIVIMTCTCGPLVILARLLRIPEGPRSIYGRAIRWWARGVSWAAGARVHVHGAEHLVNTNGLVVVANHVSWFDIFALASEVPWCSFIAKSELKRLPLFGLAADAAGIVFIDRDNKKAAFESYRRASDEVRRGRAIVVCPEGTRGRDYHLRPFKKGPFVLAIAAQAPIVPALVYGAREVMPKGSFRIRSGRVDLHFLQPVPTAGLDYDDRARLMSDVWSHMAAEMKALYGVGTAERPIAPEGSRRE